MLNYCPHCGAVLPRGSSDLGHAETLPLTPAPPYDQVAHWRKLFAEAASIAEPPPSAVLVERLVERPLPKPGPRPLPSIVHILFKGSCTPLGGSLLRAVAAAGRSSLESREALEHQGYVLQDGRVLEINGVPVGRPWLELHRWGGPAAYKRWHLARPISLNPSRHGDPFFMDDSALAFGSAWDELTLFAEAMRALLDSFRHAGAGPRPQPLLIDVLWQ